LVVLLLILSKQVQRNLTVLSFHGDVKHEISILDCCRLENKGFSRVEEKVPGQLALIHATDIGKAALGGSQGQCSEVTKDFLNVMKQTH